MTIISSDIKSNLHITCKPVNDNKCLRNKLYGNLIKAPDTTSLHVLNLLTPWYMRASLHYTISINIISFFNCSQPIDSNYLSSLQLLYCLLINSLRHRALNPSTT